MAYICIKKQNKNRTRSFIVSLFDVLNCFKNDLHIEKLYFMTKLTAQKIISN